MSLTRQLMRAIVLGVMQQGKVDDEPEPCCPEFQSFVKKHECHVPRYRTVIFSTWREVLVPLRSAINKKHEHDSHALGAFSSVEIALWRLLKCSTVICELLMTLSAFL